MGYARASVSQTRSAPRFLLAATLGLAACLPFLPALGNAFTDWDDPLYLTMNAHVRAGLTPESLRWAFTTNETANWHPLTWIAHETAWMLFGDHAGAHHALSIVLHGVIVALLFWILARTTGATGRSAAAALLFGVHPLRVESVAWASELKDVLAALFWMLGVLAWIRWTESKRPAHYILVVAALGLGLLAKPMLVTFPFALLLLDRWPLGRWGKEGASSLFPPWRLVSEKAALFALAIGSCAVTLSVQRSAMPTGESFSLGEDLANAVVSYVAYLGKTVWPVDLSPFYPHMGPTLPAWKVAAAAVLLAVVTAAVFRLRRRAPYAWFGWLWYAGTLVPVIGIVRVGSQAMADRYTYIPSIGISIAVVWGVADLLRTLASRMGASSRSSVLEGTAAALAILALLPLTWRQTALWKDSITLFTHALSIDARNPLAHNNLGIALEAEGRTDEAIAHYRQALDAAPENLNARGNLAFALLFKGERAEAEERLRALLHDRPGDPAVLEALGEIALENGRPIDAVPLLTEAVAASPGFGKAEYQLSRALAGAGKPADAIAHAEHAEQAGLRDAKLYAHLSSLYLSTGRLEDARRTLEVLVRLEPGYAPAHSNLAAVCSRLGLLDEARHEAELARGGS